MDIKHRITSKVLFSSEKKTIKEALIEAVEKNTDLGGADLRGADLGGAYLVRADLVGADLRGADLTGAYLGGAYLECIKITEKEKEQIIKELRWEITK